MPGPGDRGEREEGEGEERGEEEGGREGGRGRGREREGEGGREEEYKQTRDGGAFSWEMHWTQQPTANSRNSPTT